MEEAHSVSIVMVRSVGLLYLFNIQQSQRVLMLLTAVVAIGVLSAGHLKRDLRRKNKKSLSFILRYETEGKDKMITHFLPYHPAATRSHLKASEVKKCRYCLLPLLRPLFPGLR